MAEPREKAFELALVAVIARREAREALRNRWFLLYAVAFAAVALGLSAVALAGTGSYGFAGFGRTAASLVNLVLLMVPLMGLTVGATALAAERERGTLEVLLTHPVNRGEVLAGKYVGAAAALAAALATGFGLSGLVLGLQGGMANLGAFAAVCGLSVLLAWAMLSVGFLISAWARRAAVAVAVALFLWLAFVLFSDLALMGSAVAFRLRAEELFGLAVLNPLQVFKIGAIGQLHASLDLLGPVGLYASRAFGAGLPWLLLAALAAWLVLPLGLALAVFRLRGLR